MERFGRYHYLTQEESMKLLLNDMHPDETALELQDAFFENIERTILNVHRDEKRRIVANAIEIDEKAIADISKANPTTAAKKDKVFIGEASLVGVTVATEKESATMEETQVSEKKYGKVCVVICTQMLKAKPYMSIDGARRKRNDYTKYKREFLNEERVFA